MVAERSDPNHLPIDTARKFVWYAVVEAGVAGFIWGVALFALLYGDWPRTILAIFCAAALSLAACFLARRVARSIV
jgi:hypothetical protein